MMLAIRPTTLRTNLIAAFVLCAAAVFACGGTAKAQSGCGECVTIVPGGPVVGQTWTAANSPYCVTGDLFISNLTIEPGVCVLIDGQYELHIQTIINAQGTKSHPIVFTAKDPDVSKWKGMEFFQTVPGSVLRYCVFSHADDSAIRLIETAPTIEHCTFVDNTAPFLGGAIYAELTSAVLELQQCRFEGNQVNPTLAGGSGFGGAVYVDGGIEVSDCEFDGNTAHGRVIIGGGNQTRTGAGGGLAAVNGNVTLTNSIFRNNHADCIGSQGPGSNSARRARGGAIYLDSGTGAVHFGNTIMGGNTLLSSGGPGSNEESGGGLYIASGDVTLTNVSIARNDRAGLHIADGDVSVVNSILFFNFNGGDQLVGEACVHYSIVQNGFTGDCGDNNIAFNPAFSGPGTTLCDLTILEFSPAIDAGDPDPKFNDSDECSGPPFGTERNDMGAHGGPGACWSIPSGIPGDLNNDCVVGVADLLILLANWGPCPDPSDCPADLNGDGSVGVADLLILLANWG